MLLKRVIVTADDFGLSKEVNAAVETAHLHGVLNTASLMVSGATAGDAVRRAKRLPDLQVGLHVAVLDAMPTLPAKAVPLLVDGRGRLRGDHFGAGIDYFLRPAARRQLRAEIRAQFQAFRATGLDLDHVNAHHHMHLHPTVLGIILECARDFGARAIRLPGEPWRSCRRAAGRERLGRMLARAGLWPWLALMRRRIKVSGLACNACLLGMADFGRMREDLVLQLLDELTDGVTEMHFHPAVAPGEEWRQQELDALLSPAVRSRMRVLGIERTSFGDLAGRASRMP